MQTTDFDIIVVGGGLVGSSAALALAKQGHHVALVDRNLPEFSETSPILNDSWDSRIYAISPGNVTWLETLGVWQKLDHSRISPIENMQVWGDEAATPLIFESYEANLTNLGCILESNQLQHALWSQMQDAGVHVEIAGACGSLLVETDQAVLRLAEGRVLSAKLIIAADGGNSWVREQAGIAIKTQHYQQAGVVANFETELPHGNIARQWFSPDGVLAWLPLSGNRISMVWSTQNSQELLVLPPDALAERVANAGNAVLGKLRTITHAVSYPLMKQVAHRLVQARLVLVGDAAHRVHPLAGQGVNLGFRDVIELAKVLDNRNPYQDIGDESLLRRYERARKTDILAVSTVTHGLQQLFESEMPLVKRMRNAGLLVTNQQAGLKRRLIKQAVI